MVDDSENGKLWKRNSLETQFMLLESKDEVEGNGDDALTIYTVFLPLLEGQFRAVLQGNEKNEIEICLESGDKAVETSQGTHLVYVHAGTNPFEVIRQSVKAAERHMQTFHHREKKKYDSFFHVRKRWDKAIGQEVVRLKEENAEQAKKICDLGFQLEDTKKEIA